MAMNTNCAPFPEELDTLVRLCEYRPGWTVDLFNRDRGQECIGLTLIITTSTINSYHPDQPIRVHHFFPVPPAAYDVRSWRRWLFEQFRLVESHEAAEFFKIAGERPFAPSHGPGNDPYLIRELGTDTDVRTSFRGALNG